MEKLQLQSSARNQENSVEITASSTSSTLLQSGRFSLRYVRCLSELILWWLLSQETRIKAHIPMRCECLYLPPPHAHMQLGKFLSNVGNTGRQPANQHTLVNPGEPGRSCCNGRTFYLRPGKCPILLSARHSQQCPQGGKRERELFIRFTEQHPFSSCSFQLPAPPSVNTGSGE